MDPFILRFSNQLPLPSMIGSTMNEGILYFFAFLQYAFEYTVIKFGGFDIISRPVDSLSTGTAGSPDPVHGISENHSKSHYSE